MFLSTTYRKNNQTCTATSERDFIKVDNHPQEAQKTAALWTMKAAKDRKEEFYDPACKDNILGRSTTRLELWEEHLKDPIVALDKALKCVEDQY